MNIKQFIAELNKLNPKMEIVCTSSNFETNYAVESFSGGYVSKMSQKERTFVDAFDHESYTKKVWIPDDINGKEVYKL